MQVETLITKTLACKVEQSSKYVHAALNNNCCFKHRMRSHITVAYTQCFKFKINIFKTGAATRGTKTPVVSTDVSKATR